MRKRTLRMVAAVRLAIRPISNHASDRRSKRAWLHEHWITTFTPPTRVPVHRIRDYLGDSFGSFKDEHLVPGRGSQRCGDVLEHLVSTGFDGVVSLEVSTRKMRTDVREEALAESLAYARHHLGQHDLPGAQPLRA